METIKDRLAHILRAKNLTASQFAEMMEIQPSNVSHLLNGRNNPSLDFLIKLKEIFPEYSFDWIIMGKKPITINEPAPFPPEQIQMFETLDNNRIAEFDDLDEHKEPNEVRKIEILSDVVENHNVNNEDVDIMRMIIVYSDNTFDVITPRKRIN